VLIDWFTVAAQMVNFLILVVLLKVLLYDRIIKAMDARQQAIADRLADAQRKRAEAEEQAESYRRKNDELEASRQEWLSEAKQEADAHRKHLTEQARADVDELKARWRRTVEQETAQFLAQLREKAGRQVCTISRQALTDLAHAELESEMVAAFLARLGEMDPEERRAFTEALEDADAAVSVYSSFEMPDAGRSVVSEGVRRILGGQRAVAFEQDSDLVCGIELRAGGRAVGWNVAGYLDRLESDFSQELAEEAGRSWASAKPNGSSARSEGDEGAAEKT